MLALGGLGGGGGVVEGHALVLAACGVEDVCEVEGGGHERGIRARLVHLLCGVGVAVYAVLGCGMWARKGTPDGSSSLAHRSQGGSSGRK